MKQKFKSSSCIGFSRGEEEREKSSRDKWCNNENLKVSLVYGMILFNWDTIKALLLSLSLSLWRCGCASIWSNPKKKMAVESI